MNNKRIIVKIINFILTAITVSAVVFILYWFIQITTACSFHTPSGSMSPTLLPDESGLVNKWKLGARIFNIVDAVEGKPYTIKRLPGYGQLERGDVIVFNYPYQDKTEDSIAMNLRMYYCKRAIAVAGDSLEIRNCFYHVKGHADTIGVASEQKQLQNHIDYFLKHNTEYQWWMRCAPYDTLFNWSVRDMGPILIPGKGTIVNLDRKNCILHRKYIEWESKSKLMWLDSVAVLDGKPLKSYTFTENYCFAAGDHVIDSKDSRYFGLIPEKFIVGTAGILWKSHDHRRIFTIIN